MREAAESEVGMVQHVERLEPKVQTQALVKRKDPGNLSVELEEGRRPESISADVAIGSYGRAAVYIAAGTIGSNLRKGRRRFMGVQIPASDVKLAADPDHR